MQGRTACLSGGGCEGREPNLIVDPSFYGMVKVLFLHSSEKLKSASSLACTGNIYTRSLLMHIGWQLQLTIGSKVKGGNCIIQMLT